MTRGGSIFAMCMRGVDTCPVCERGGLFSCHWPNPHRLPVLNNRCLRLDYSHSLFKSEKQRVHDNIRLYFHTCLSSWYLFVIQQIILDEHWVTIMILEELLQWNFSALREESIQTNVILQYKLLAAILSAVCSVIQQS